MTSLLELSGKVTDKRYFDSDNGLVRLQKGLQMEAPLCSDIPQPGCNWAGISRQAALLVAFGPRSLLQIISTSLDGIAIGIKCSDRAGSQARFAVTVETG